MVVRVKTLSPRELEVLRLVADGQPSKAIGTVLGISEKTVRGHVESVFRKLKARTRAHAVYLVMKAGVLEAAPGPAREEEEAWRR